MLQLKIISLINDLGGIDYYARNLDRVRPLSPESKRYQIDEMKIYARLLYEIEVDVESDSIHQRDKLMSAYKIFHDLYLRDQDVFCYKVLEIISVMIYHSDNIRMIC
jgi:hypothetical protein